MKKQCPNCKSYAVTCSSIGEIICSNCGQEWNYDLGNLIKELDSGLEISNEKIELVKKLGEVFTDYVMRFKFK